MHTFVQAVGAIAFFAGAAALLFAAFRLLNGVPADAIFWGYAGLGCMVSGGTLFCLGAMTEYLRSIRDGLEVDRQNRRKA